MPVKGRILFLLFLLCMVTSNNAQTQQFIVTPYEEVAGITTKSISDFVQGSQGFLWFASYEGLIKFDGHGFKKFTNQNGFTNSIIKIAEDKQQNIWMVFADGSLAKFDPITRSFTNITIKYPPHSTNEKPGGIESMFFDRDNHLWLGVSRRGLVKINTANGNAEVFEIIPESDTHFSPEIRKFYNRVLNIYEDGQNMLWMATADGLYTFNRGTHQMKKLIERPAQPNAFRDDSYRAIVKQGNKLWIGSWGGGLSSYDLGTGKLEIFKFDLEHKESHTANIIHSLIVKNDSILYIASADKGFMAFNTITKKFIPFSNNPLYKNIPAWLWTKVAFDKDDNIWALNEMGLMKIRPSDYRFQFHRLAVTHSDNNIFFELMDVWENERLRLIATNFTSGLHLINKKNGNEKILPIERNTVEENVNKANRIKQGKDGNVWVCTRDFIYQFNPATEQLMKPVQPVVYNNKESNVFADISPDFEGNLWIGTLRNGMFRYNTRNKTYDHFFPAGDAAHNVPTNLISSVATDSTGRVWFASNRGYISYCEPNTTIVQPATAINKILPGLAEEKTSSFFVDSKGFLWISVKTGLLKIDCNTPQPTFVKKYSVADGFRSEVIVELTEDKAGNIWCLEPLVYGVSMIDASTSKITKYGFRDGINQSGEVLRLVTVGDKIWLLCQGGYYECNPSAPALQPKEQPLAIMIMAVNAIDKLFEKEVKERGKVMLEANENSFYFEFTTIDFSRPESYMYEYMLEGFDTGWIACGTRHSVSYTNIPGGNYRFKVRSGMAKGDWGKTEVSIPFFIKTPFYKKWWFFSIFILSILFGIYIFYLFRLKKQRQILLLETKAQTLEKEKTRVQYENLKQHLNPHFLFNSLTSLGSLIRINPQMAISFLDGMSKIYRYILQSKDSELVYLKDELKFVQTFIHLQKTRFNNGLQVTINVSEDYALRKIVPVSLQNLIENAIKHNIVDDETPLYIDIFIEQDFLIVRNNLQKKTFVETSNKQGLDNLVSLYRYLSGKPLLIAEDGQYFTVKIPLI